MKYCPECTQPLLRKEMDGHQRLFCTDETCGFIHWNNPVPVVAMVVETELGIVLAHNKKAPKNRFSIITGFLEAKEDPKTAAERETEEELGLQPTETNFIGVFSFARANQLVIAYHVKAQGNVTLNEELDDYKIVQKTELLGYSTAQRFEIQQWLDKLEVLA